MNDIINETTDNVENRSLWEYFEKIPDSDKKAKCRLCNSIYCYRTTITNLKHHLVNKHQDNLDINPELLVNTSRSRVVKRERYLVSREKSSVWKYFEVTDENSRTAVCLQCNRQFSFKSTSYNLKSHLIKKHPDIIAYEDLKSTLDNTVEEIYLELDEEKNTSEEEGTSQNSTDALVWRYFEKETGGRARCVPCGRSMPVSRAAQHLKENHERLLAQGVKTLKQEEDSENDLFEAEENSLEQTKLTYKKRKHSAESSYLEVKPEKVQSQKEETIDHFLKYIGTLLKELRPDQQTKLQMDIINMIMMAKLSNERKSDSYQGGNENRHIVIMHNGVPENVQVQENVRVMVDEGQGFGNTEVASTSYSEKMQDDQM